MQRMTRERMDELARFHALGLASDDDTTWADVFAAADLRAWANALAPSADASEAAPDLVRTDYPDGSSEVHVAGCGSGSCCGGCVPPESLGRAGRTIAPGAYR